MNKIAVSVLLILFGLLLLLKNSNLLPDNFCATYSDLAHSFWPVLIILFGLQLLIKEKFVVLARIIIWVILFLFGLWMICQMLGQNSWIT